MSRISPSASSRAAVIAAAFAVAAGLASAKPAEPATSAPGAEAEPAIAGVLEPSESVLTLLDLVSTDSGGTRVPAAELFVPDRVEIVPSAKGDPMVAAPLLDPAATRARLAEALRTAMEEMREADARAIAAELAARFPHSADGEAARGLLARLEDFRPVRRLSATDTPRDAEWTLQCHDLRRRVTAVVADGESGSVMLGTDILRPGDRIPDTAATIVRIEHSALTVRFSDGEHAGEWRVEMGR
jgi:hypothetical protein